MTDSKAELRKPLGGLRGMGLWTSLSGVLLAYMFTQLGEPIFAALAGMLFGWGTITLGIQYALKRSVIDE